LSYSASRLCELPTVTMQISQLDDEQKWPPAMTTLLLALEAALNSMMHALPHAPFPAIACLLEDPLLLQAYQRPPQLNFQPQLSPRIQSYFRQHRMATVLNGALNAVLAARPDPAHALGALAEELRRSSPVAPKPAPPMPKATSAEEVALQQAMQRLQQAVQSAMGTLTAVAPRDCGAALLLLMEHQQGAAARGFVRLMVEAGVTVDEGTYLPMLAVAQRRGDWREAIELLVHAKEIKSETGGQSYNLTLTACASACEERACRQLLEQMVAKGLDLSQETQSALHAAGLGSLVPVAVPAAAPSSEAVDQTGLAVTHTGSPSVRGGMRGRGRSGRLGGGGGRC